MSISKHRPIAAAIQPDYVRHVVSEVPPWNLGLHVPLASPFLHDRKAEELAAFTPLTEWAPALANADHL
jgi:hypothetical protein